MVGGVERYYQVAKCFRDEDLRKDRQPEFTQVDVEMSFVTEDDVMGALEHVLAKAFGKMGVKLELPLRRIQYWDAMDTYGTDKPDTRYGMELHDVTPIFSASKFKLLHARPPMASTSRPSTPRAPASGPVRASTAWPTSPPSLAPGAWPTSPSARTAR